MKTIAVPCLLLLITACSQTAQQPETTATLSQTDPEPSFSITETAIGHANLKLAGYGSARNLLRQRACILGKYATENGATHILMPEKPQITLVAEGGNSRHELDHPFEYFVSGQNIPDRAKTRDKLLSECRA